MKASAVRNAPAPVAASRPAPTQAQAQALRFSELLRQRRPDEPEAGDTPPLEADASTTPDLPPRPAPVAEPDEETPDDTMPEAPPAAATAVDVAWALPDDRCHAAMREVGLTVAGFCNDRAVAGSDLWQVRMGLRADVVPDTTLHLTLSPHWLTLRFQTDHDDARDLLSRGQETLVQVLENTLSRKREIAITFESP